MKKLSVTKRRSEAVSVNFTPSEYRELREHIPQEHKGHLASWCREIILAALARLKGMQ